MEPFKNKVWLSSPTMHGEELKYMTEAYNTNWMSTVGENINEVERIAAEKIGCKYAVVLSCGTASLHLCMKLAGIKPGDKVFCTDITFDATVNPIVYEGGVPVFIDTEYDTWNMDPAALEKAFEIYPEVKVVVVANLYGTPGKMDEIAGICKKHNAVMIEDAAESFGATYKGRETGTFGTYNAISFNGNKIITGSSGGMLLTDSKAAAEKARKWSTQSMENAPWYQHEELGYGGADLMMREVRECFKVDVERYIRVNFATFKKGIDSVGGIDINLTAAEAAYLNGETKSKTYTAGVNRLDGIAALSYARCRHIDSDWHRIERQRNVIQAVVTKTKDLSVGELNTMLNNVLPLVQTNLTRLEITELLLSAPKYRGVEIKQMTVPISGSYGGMRGLGGRSLFSVDFDTNAKALREFIYGVTAE